MHETKRMRVDHQYPLACAFFCNQAVLIKSQKGRMDVSGEALAAGTARITGG